MLVVGEPRLVHTGVSAAGEPQETFESFRASPAALSCAGLERVGENAALTSTRPLSHQEWDLWDVEPVR